MPKDKKKHQKSSDSVGFMSSGLQARPLSSKPSFQLGAPRYDMYAPSGGNIISTNEQPNVETINRRIESQKDDDTIACRSGLAVANEEGYVMPSGGDSIMISWSRYQELKRIEQIHREVHADQQEQLKRAGAYARGLQGTIDQLKRELRAAHNTVHELMGLPEQTEDEFNEAWDCTPDDDNAIDNGYQGAHTAPENEAAAQDSESLQTTAKTFSGALDLFVEQARQGNAGLLRVMKAALIKEYGHSEGRARVDMIPIDTSHDTTVVVEELRKIRVYRWEAEDKRMTITHYDQVT